MNRCSYITVVHWCSGMCKIIVNDPIQSSFIKWDQPWHSHNLKYRVKLFISITTTKKMLFALVNSYYNRYSYTMTDWLPCCKSTDLAQNKLITIKMHSMYLQKLSQFLTYDILNIIFQISANKLIMSSTTIYNKCI